MKYRILLFCCLFFNEGWSQLKVGYWLSSDVVRIPFEIVNHSIFVKVNLNKYRNLNFIVDTGSSFSVVFTDSLLRVPSQYKVSSIRGFGKLDSIPASISVFNTLSVGGLTSFGQQILVVDKNLVGFQQYFDRQLHGIIGLDILRNYDLEINFVTQKLIIRKKGIAEKKNNKWTRIPFEISKNGILLPAAISNHKLTEHPISLILDTGSELPLLLKERFCPPNSIQTIIGLGFLGYASGSIGSIATLKIGEIKVKDIIASFPDSTSVDWSHEFPQAGNLGIQFLNQFRVIINYNKSYLLLKPNHKKVSGSARFNRSGMAVRSSLNFPCAFYIDEIASNSPADKAGLKKGDQILSINKSPCPKLSLEIINDHLFSENPALPIEIYHEGAIRNVLLDLRHR